MPDLNIFPDTKIIDIRKSKDIDVFIDKYQIRDTRIRIMPSSVITPGRISGIAIRTNRTISPDILGSDIDVRMLRGAFKHLEFPFIAILSCVKEDVLRGWNAHHVIDHLDVRTFLEDFVFEVIEFA